ncbi:MAG: preprotein translocase subunit SecE [Eubacteriales bacterium]|nr:preprotein translocase subunit SecE [Eubacteriales bacterium]
MADTKKAVSKKNDKAKRSWKKGLKAEWDKIVWTDKKTLGKQTGVVAVVSLIICALITLIDSLGLQIMQLIIK